MNRSTREKTNENGAQDETKEDVLGRKHHAAVQEHGCVMDALRPPLNSVSKSVL